MSQFLSLDPHIDSPHTLTITHTHSPTYTHVHRSERILVLHNTRAKDVKCLSQAYRSMHKVEPHICWWCGEVLDTETFHLVAIYLTLCFHGLSR